MVMQRKETQTVNRGRGHGEWRNIWRRGRREQGQGTAGKRRWINMFVWIQGLLCEDESSDLALISPMAAQDQIRKQMRWYCGCKHSEFHIQEGEREVQNKGRERLPACVFGPAEEGRAWQWSQCPLWPSGMLQGCDTRQERASGRSWALSSCRQTCCGPHRPGAGGRVFAYLQGLLELAFPYPRQARKKRENSYFKGIVFFFHIPLSLFRMHLWLICQKGCLICKLDHILLMNFFVGFQIVCNESPAIIKQLFEWFLNYL